MFISARMKKVQILTLASDEPRVTEAVGEMGVLHLTRAPAEAGALPVEGDQSRESEALLETLEKRADALCEALGIDAAEAPASLPHLTLQKAEAELDRIEREVSAVVEERGQLAGRRRHLEKLLRDTSVLRDIDAPIEQLEHMSFLHFAIGRMSRTHAVLAEEELGDRAVVLPYQDPFGQDRVVAISSKKGRWALESVLGKHDFQREALPSDETGVPARVAELAEERMAALLERIKENNRALREAAEVHGPLLRAVRRRIRTERRILTARRHFAHTWATMLITGWVPAERLDELCETVLDLTRGHAVIEVRAPSPDDEEPPTMMKNSRFLRPFERLVAAYGTPRYNEIDPTPLLAVLFVVMFGMMFGDVGHSGLLFLAGLVLWWRGKDTLRDAGVILTFCGASGVLFGFLYGSVFGIEEIGGKALGLLPPLHNTQRLLVLTVLFGAGVISLGIVLNVINHVFRREYAAAALDRFGIAGGVFYWGSILVAVRAAVAGGERSGLIAALLVVLPLVVLFARRPVAELLRRRRREPASGESIAFLLLESAIEVFDTVLLYLANTLSFARLAAFALAHAGLSFAVFEIMRAVRELPGGSLWAGGVFVFGTLAILLLEGLIVAIQSMRLQYYEFFNKFFSGEGRKYEPFHLAS